MTDKVILGRFGAAYGVRGWLHLISFTDPIDNIFNYTEWHVKHRGKWAILHLEQGKTHGKGLVVKLDEINNREQAREYTNDEISVPREALPELPEDEHFWQDLMGMTVTTKNGITLGIVKDMIATGSNDVFVVAGERERLIPYTDKVIIKIDKNKKEMIVDWDPEF